MTYKEKYAQFYPDQEVEWFDSDEIENAGWHWPSINELVLVQLFKNEVLMETLMKRKECYNWELEAVIVNKQIIYFEEIL